MSERSHPLCFIVVMLIACAACAKSEDTGQVREDAGSPHDAATTLPGNAVSGPVLDASQLNRLPDAFFAEDPAPPMCGEDGIRVEPETAEPSECPPDKNREGCPCKSPGKSASCWPGKRIHRNHGQCVDGKTECRETPEFGPAWGPCEGYVLPDDSAVEGPAACRCFSSGEWALKNLVPCIYDTPEMLSVTSSIEDSQQGFRCEADTDPNEDWTSSTLKVECAGRFQLCYTLKAGDVDNPKASDCTMRRLCIDTWYPKPDVVQKLPNLPGWRAANNDCTRRFVEEGGYGEMSVQGVSSECDAVDDGQGDPYVFKRTRYCSIRCGMTPDRPECKACGTGVSGQF
ncbi:MAG: hypothetical protein ABW321_32950 [Polyangiales bacterium]